MSQGSANGEKKERWRELCEHALVETDSRKLLELTEEVIRLLAEEEAYKTDLGDRLVA